MPPPVPREQVRTPEINLALHKLYRDARQRLPDRSRPALTDVRIADVHEVLAHAVALQNRVTELRAEVFEHLRRQRRRPRNEQPHRPSDLAGRVVRKIEQADVDRRDAEEERGLEVEELGGRLLVLEPR